MFEQTIIEDKEELHGNEKIVCTYEDYNKYAEVFEHMSFKALEYVPDLETIKKIIVPNLPEYILFCCGLMKQGMRQKKMLKSEDY